MTAPAHHVIIFVDDEPLLRELACEALADEGFEVLQARNADEALEILEKRAPEVRALFTDIDMPGSMDGLALAHHASRKWPWIGVLIASGRPSPQARAMPAGSRFISKPYTARKAAADLNAVIALAGGRAPARSCAVPGGFAARFAFRTRLLGGYAAC